MQIVKGEEYKQISESKTSINMAQKAPRGEIRDRYGKILVGNKATYSLSLIKTDISDKEFNNTVLKILNILRDDGREFTDSLPINPETFELSFESEDDKEKWFSFYGHEKYINRNMQGKEILAAMAGHIYKIPSDLSDSDIRRIAGVRYEAEKSGFSTFLPFELADDISVSVISKIKESAEEFPCVAITNSFSRNYFNDGFASHIIGRVGKMNDEEYASYKEKGYKFNETVGKQGVEKMAESFLRGKDGVRGIENGSSTVVREIAAIPGNNVMLTIDIQMQKVLESSLEKIITKISKEGGAKTGSDANSGAAVVVDVTNGDILACASYPSYNLESFRTDYNTLAADKDLPLWNRAVSGAYSPGSTFKPLVAIAALESGKISPEEKIDDKGIYDVYNDYRPRCWIWSEDRMTHGSINVTTAIEQSCNYFFYEAGNRTGIDTISEYAARFGLGADTGTGLPEEACGYVANPENKKKVISNTSEQSWYAADTLQAAIGQSINSFTPVQIANYIATIANGGTRYKLNIIKSIRSGSDGSLLAEIEPQIEERIQIKPENLSSVRLGMKNVVEEGSAKGIFREYPVEIGGKTGTAQVGTKVSNNALFAAFAPFDNPQIAVCVVIEHGVRGANAAFVAKDLFDYYFNLNE